MKKLSKSLLSIILCAGVLCCIAGCNGESSSKADTSVSSDNEKQTEKITIENPAINQTVLYDQNDIKITAEKIENDDNDYLIVNCTNNTEKTIYFHSGCTDHNPEGIEVTYNYFNGKKENEDIESTSAEVQPKSSGELSFWVDIEKLKNAESVSIGIEYSYEESDDETYLYPLTVKVIDKSNAVQNN